MSFSQTKRPDVFAPTNDTPGPTDYELKSNLVSDDKNKKFGFIQNDKRFKAFSKEPALEIDDAASNSSSNAPQPPLPATARTRPTSSTAGSLSEAIKYKKNAEKWQSEYERAMISHQRDMAGLEERLSRLDVSLKEALREKSALSSQAIAKEKELQELSKKHAMLKSNLEKTEKQTTNLVEKATRSTMLERKLTDLEKTTAKTRTLADAKSTTLEKLQLERKELRLLADALRKQVDDLVADKTRHDAALLEVETQRSELVVKVEELEEKFGAKQEEVGSWEVKVASVQQQCDGLALAKVDAEEKLECVTRALEATRSEWEAGKSTLQLLEADLKARTEALSAAGEEKGELLAQRAALGEQVKALSGEMEAVTRSREELEKEKRALETLVDEMQTRNLEVGAILERLEASVGEKSAHIETLEQLRTTEQTEFEDVIESLKGALTLRESESTEKMHALTEELNELRSHLETGMHEILRRDEQIEGMVGQEEDLRTQIESIKAELNETAQLVDTWKSRFQEVDVLKTQLEARVTELTDDLQFLSAQMQGLQVELDSSQSRAGLLETEVSKLSHALGEAIEALAMANETHSEAVAVHEAQMDELNSQLSEQSQYRAGEKDMAELRIATIQATHLDTLQQKAEAIFTLEQSVTSLQQSLASKQQELETLTTTHRQEINKLTLDLTEQEELVSEYRERAYDNESAMDECHQQIDELKSKMQAKVSAHNAELAEIAAAYKRIIGEFQEKEETLNTEKAFLSDELSEALKRVQERDAQLVDTDAVVVSLKEQLAAMESRIAGLSRVLEESTGSGQTLQKQLAESIGLNARLEGENADKDASIRRLEADLGASRVRLEDAGRVNEELEGKIREASDALAVTVSELNGRAAALEQKLEEEKERSAELSHLLEAKSAEFESLVVAHAGELSAKSAEVESLVVAHAGELSAKSAELKSLVVAHAGELSAKSAEFESLVVAHEGELSAKSAEFKSLVVAHAGELSAKESDLSAALASKSQLQSQLDSLLGEHTSAKSRISDLLSAVELETNAHDSTKTRCMNLDAELSSERDANARFSAKVTELEALLLVEQESGRDLRDLVRTLELVKGENAEELARLNAALVAEKDAHATSKLEAEVAMTTEREVVATERLRSHELASSLEAQVALASSLSTELASVKISLESQTTACREALKTVAALESDLKTERTNVDDISRTVTALQLSLEQERAAHALTVKSNSDLLATLESERESRRQTEASFESQVSTLTADLDASATYAKNLKQSLLAEQDAHTTTRDDSEKKIAEFTKYHGETKGNVALLVAALEQEKLVAQEKEDSATQLSLELSETKAELVSNRMELVNLKGRLAANTQSYDAERESHHASLAESQGRCERLIKALADNEALVKDLETEVSAVKLRHANEVGSRDQELRVLKERLQTVELSCQEMKASSAGSERAKMELLATKSHAEKIIKDAADDKAEYESLLEQNADEIKTVKKENE
ncbi:hypothetical protein HDU98_010546, partial [Podochytrium sp. JEL0797]